jgi:glycosyltransferase involved in cell wall biosynthesis
MEFPKISIVTPSYNQAKYLEETIISVLSQNYPNLEYIVIDGGSTDGSVEIIKKYETKLSYWVTEKDQGMYHAIQKGFNKSRGEIMGWINSDDLYHRNSLFTAAGIFTDLPEINWIQGNPTVIDEMGRTVNCRPLQSRSKFQFYLRDFVHTKDFIQQESTFWRRSLWEKAGSKFNLSYRYAADFDLWINFFRYEKLYVTPALIGGFRIRRSDQASLDHFSTYLEEAVGSLNNYPLSHEEEKHLSKIKAFRKTMLRIPVFRNSKSLIRYHESLYNYPPAINFNRQKQKFEFIKS